MPSIAHDGAAAREWLGCACPDLRPEAYTGDTIGAQLRDNARDYVNSPAGTALGSNVKLARSVLGLSLVATRWRLCRRGEHSFKLYSAEPSAVRVWTTEPLVWSTISAQPRRA